MTEAQDALTAEELVTLAEIAGLRLDDGDYCVVKGDGLIWSGIETDAFRPDQNWRHLGMVIEGMAALGFRLQLNTGARVDGSLYYRAEWIGGLFAETMSGPQLSMQMAICRSALAASTEHLIASDVNVGD